MVTFQNVNRTYVLSISELSISESLAGRNVVQLVIVSRNTLNTISFGQHQKGGRAAQSHTRESVKEMKTWNEAKN